MQGGVSSLGTGMDSSTHTTAIHALSESDEDMAVPGGMVTPVDQASTVSLDSGSISGQTVELFSDSESVVEVGGPGLGFNGNAEVRSPTPVFPASDLRLRLSTIEMSRLAAERRKAIPKRKRRPDHSITYPARPLIHIITIPAQPAVIPVITIPATPAIIPVITIVTDRAQSNYELLKSCTHNFNCVVLWQPQFKYSCLLSFLTFPFYHLHRSAL